MTAPEDWFFLRRDRATGAVRAYRLQAGGVMQTSVEYAPGSAWWEAGAAPSRVRIRVEGYLAETEYRPGEGPAVEPSGRQIEQPPKEIDR